ncbi:uncharacterized protein BJ212DRAFT_1299129 [Suillus subaureus]|uniref:Uncharacterized protein n=1 Tax=Suillus subaureus TaxID=48587 RepID=A0A9P7ECD2_9AGAM|nr:uncharacterized protein BJ212DRAFT_1299129 [Suillus subaureus]KAG1817588.1 hypothetical protein BJ212DRAFT_1299129 [Suillus subaureus]
MSSKNYLDLTIGVIGAQVPQTSPSITWRNGYKTVLPTIFDGDDVNLCDEVNILLIKYMAQLPTSDVHSQHVHHLASHSLSTSDVMNIISKSLSINKCMKITRVPFTSSCNQFDLHYLDVEFGISPLRPMQVHDVKVQCHNHAKPQIFSTIKSFFDSLNDLMKIQCIINIPLAQISMPDQLKNLDHGIIHGWNQTCTCVPIISKVHLENFTTKGWGLLHHAGFLTYPHHDAEWTLMWLRMEVGIKFWVIFWLRSGRSDHIQLWNLSVKLADYTRNITWIQKNCDVEVIMLMPGDMFLCMMATKGQQYCAKGSSAQCAEDTKTAPPTRDIADIIYQHFGITKQVHTGNILYTGDQFDPGSEIDHVELLLWFQQMMHL